MQYSPLTSGRKGFHGHMSHEFYCKKYPLLEIVSQSMDLALFKIWKDSKFSVIYICEQQTIEMGHLLLIKLKPNVTFKIIFLPLKRCVNILRDMNFRKGCIAHISKI